MTLPERPGLLGYFVRHRTAANLLLLVLVLLGLAAAPNMRAQFFPDIVSDEVDVVLRWDDAGPEAVDRAVVSPMLPALQDIEGVVRIETRAFEGRATFELEFEPGWDMSRALLELDTALGQVSDLPDDAEAPELRQSAWFDRVTDVVITGPVGPDQLARFADDFVRRLFEAGITRTSIRGIADPQVRVEVPTISLIRHDLTLQEIAEAIRAEASSDPAGEVDAANARLRGGTARRDADAVADLVLRADSDGTVLRIRDVAVVTDRGVDRERAYFVDDNPAMSIRVDRSAQGDALAIQSLVEDVADDMVAGLPEGVRIDLIRTRAEVISSRLAVLLDNGLMGMSLVLLLLFLFLNARTALWVAAGIPVAMLAALALMYATGTTLNMLSLFGLIITLGIVVDDAIVVGEHADYRARVLGEPPAIAAERAARRMALPVFSATITTIIAFWGLVAIGGRFGELIRDIPITVIAVLAASLIECFLILPNHMRHALAHLDTKAWYDWPSRQVNRGLDWFRAHMFLPCLRVVLRARYPVLAGAVLLLASQVTLFISDAVVWRFWNAPEQDSISGNFAMAPGATREDAMAQMRELQRATEAVGARFEAEHGVAPLVYVLAEVGGNTGRPLSGTEMRDRDLLGSLAVELVDADVRPYSSYAVVDALQDEVVRHPLTETLSFRRWGSGPGGDAIHVELAGSDLRLLKAASDALIDQLAPVPEISALQSTLDYDKDDLIIDLTPQGRLMGLDIDALGRTLLARLDGMEAATFPAGPRSGSIRVEVPAHEQTADFLERMLIRVPSGAYMPLADLVTVDRQPGFAVITRENGLQVVSVLGDISEDDPARAEAIMDRLEAEILPALQTEFGVTWHLAGLAEQEEAFLRDATRGFVLCLTGIFLVLAWIFSSWTRPLAIMAVIPFGLVGTIWGHYVWDVPLSMFTVIGLIGMTGIIINDAIVLITTIDEKAGSRGLGPAIVAAAGDRLRPVLLTTLTTVLGLAPLLYETSSQAQFLRPTVITLVYGLGFGMVLVLIVVPALLMIGQDVSAAMRAGRRALRGGSRSGIARPASGLLAALLALWFAVTLGAAIQGLPPLVGPAQLGVQAAAFVAGAVGLTLLVWGGSASVMGLQKER